MKTPHIIFALCGCLAFAPRAFCRTYAFQTPDATKITHNLSWFQAESIHLTISGDEVGTADAVLWDVISATNLLQAYIASTATVSAVTNAVFPLSPSASNLEPGNYYGYIRAVQLSGATVTNQQVLARQSIKVLHSADSSKYDLVGPLNYPFTATNSLLLQGLAWGDATTNTLTNIPWSSFGGGGSSCTETDPVWTASSTGYYTRTQAAALFATGTPLYAYTETDPAWQAGTGAIWTAINAGGVTAGVSRIIPGTGVTLDPTSGVGAVTITASGGGSTDTNAVQKTGDTMTGGLTVPMLSVINTTGITARILTTNSALAIGSGANALGADSIAIGLGANAGAVNACLAIGVGANANGNDSGSTAIGVGSVADVGGIAIGQSANGKTAGVAIGYQANGFPRGIAIGRNAVALDHGVAIGTGDIVADGYGIAIGRLANGKYGGVGIGGQAVAAYSNIAIGRFANAGLAASTYRISLGANVTNAVNNSAAIRGSLYLDGATTLVFRSTFGAGDWNVGLQTETGRLYSINSEGTRTLISPHDPATGESILLSENPYAGERVTINLARMAAALEAMGHTGLIERAAIPRRDWDAEQTARAADRLDEIAAWDKARADAIKAADAWDATPAKDREGQDRTAVPDLSARPIEYSPRPCPDWIKLKK